MDVDRENEEKVKLAGRENGEEVAGRENCVGTKKLRWIQMRIRHDGRI